MLNITGGNLPSYSKVYSTLRSQDLWYLNCTNVPITCSFVQEGGNLITY